MVIKQSLLRLAVVAHVLLVSACSIYSLPGSTPVPVEERPDYTDVLPPPATTSTPSPVPSEPSVSAAYGPLLVKAEQATDQGDYEQALALLERAQRIDPNSADIYLGMAKTHDARGDFAQSQATAERGLLYCTNSAQCEALRVYTR